MQNDMLPTLIAFLFGIGSGFVFIPIILNFCKEKNIYDIPNQRKVHKTLVPRLGGVAFLPSMALSVIIAATVMSAGFREEKIQISLWSVAFCVSLLLVYAIGVIDDFIGLNAKVKFGVQIVTACTLPLCGLYINNLYGFMGIHSIPYWVGMPLTVFLIVFIDNAINLIDGIDGLAASLSVLAFAGYLYCFMSEGLTVYSIIIASLIGILVAYLYFNVWGDENKNRKIFMGDSGSLTLGFVLGFLAVKISMYNPTLMPTSASRFLFSYSLLIVPVFDVVRIIFHRFHHRKPLFQADKNHIHHRLMQAGCTQHQALLIIIAAAFGFIVFNVLMLNVVSITWVVLFDVVIFTALQMLLTTLMKRKKA